MFRPGQVFLIYLRLILFSVAIMMLNRLVFLAFNYSHFSEIGISDFIYGMRFDLLAIGFGLLPVSILALDGQWLFGKFKVFIKYYFIFLLSLFSFLNYIDVIYFNFSLKRTTWDIFHYISTGDDTTSMLPRFLVDYWYMVVIWVITILLIRSGTGFIFRSHQFRKEKIFTRSLYGVFTAVMVLISLRGGFQLKPLNIMDASRYTSSQNIPLVLNTPFTLIKTMGKENLTVPAYFAAESEMLSYFDPLFTVQGDKTSKKNVVVIIMESLSKEYIGFYNQGQGYTPFLDSLMLFSTVFDNAWANGKRSIEALPAIFSAIPNLMNEAYNTSPYAGNKIESLASILKRQNYSGHFFHGGKNGTMGFDSYARLAGFDHYYGLDEYPEKNDFDGSWGVYDIPYFQYFASRQNELKQPFLSVVFSLSAHHPYKLPAGFEGQCPEGKLPIHKMIFYSDIALKKYFNRIKGEEWYRNSIFILTADHTAQSVSPEYGTSLGVYAIPLILFDPSESTGKIVGKTTQQADICPTLLETLDIPCEALFFGQSALDSASEGFAINYLQGIYQFTDDTYHISFDGEKVLSVFKYKEDKQLQNDLSSSSEAEINKSLLKLKAIIQNYNTRMIHNKLTVQN